MDVIKKALMVLGVLWLIGFVAMLAMGFGAYNLLTSDKVQGIVAEAGKAQNDAIREARLADYYDEDSARERPPEDSADY